MKVLRFTLLAIVLLLAAVAAYALPLVLISHGNGGGPGSHLDLALALAQQGFVVAAPIHAGDNFADQSAVDCSGPRCSAAMPRVSIGTRSTSR